MLDWRHIEFRKSNEFGKTACWPSWSWKRQLTDFDLWYVLDGEGEIHINGKRYPLSPGTCCLLRPGDTVHAMQHSDKRMTQIFFHFSVLERDSNRCLNEHEHPDFPQRVNAINERFWLEQHLQGMLAYGKNKSPLGYAMFHHAMSQALIHLLMNEQDNQRTQQERQFQIVQRLKNYIDYHIEKPIQHEDLGRMVSLSPRYLSRLFKTYTGLSLKEYIGKSRLNKAKKLLSETDRTVTQVAESLGYKDIYWFSNQFKQQFGASPTSYRTHIRLAKIKDNPVHY